MPVELEQTDYTEEQATWMKWVGTRETVVTNFIQ